MMVDLARNADHKPLRRGGKAVFTVAFNHTFFLSFFDLILPPIFRE
jgi:hypothetical protein